MTKYIAVLITCFIANMQLEASQIIINNHSAKDSTSINNKEKSIQTFNSDNSLTWYQMITDIPKDDYLFFRNNITVSKVSTFVGLAALTGALMNYDKSGYKYDKSLYHKSFLFINTSNVLVFWGDGPSHFILSGLFAAYGFAEQDPTALKTASNIIEAELSAGLLVQVLKRITGRESPAGSDKTLGDWKFFPSIKEYQKDQPKYYSFPSGHMAAATAVLTVIANDYPQYPWIRPVGYCALGLLGVSLVSQGMHWYSDLPLGFFIGYSIGNIVAPETDAIKGKDNSEAHKIIFAPSLGYKDIGFNVAYTF